MTSGQPPKDEVLDAYGGQEYHLRFWFVSFYWYHSPPFPLLSKGSVLAQGRFVAGPKAEVAY